MAPHGGRAFPGPAAADETEKEELPSDIRFLLPGARPL